MAIRAARTFLMLLALTLTGCSTIGGWFCNEILSVHERSEDANFCAKQCASLKGDDYVLCHKKCVSEEEERRSARKAAYEWKRQTEELEKRVAKQARKGTPR